MKKTAYLLIIILFAVIVLSMAGNSSGEGIVVDEGDMATIFLLPQFP